MAAKVGKVRGRFAPSPSGRMHMGNLFTALLAWLDIRALGGEMLLRMEDLDPDRCREEYVQWIAEDLRWLGLDWDLGWPDEEFRQSKRTPQYEAAFQSLERKGLLYPCYCSRKDLLAASAPHESDGQHIYSGRCRSLATKEKLVFEQAGRRPAWRVQVPEEQVSFLDGNYGLVTENLARDCGDFILRRSDGVYAYQLAVAADDGIMEVTRVVRGRDLLSSTARQIWLMEKLGNTPPVYCHVPLLMAGDGRRLSKRERDLDAAALRRRTTPERLTGFLAWTAGLIDRPEPVTPRELLSDFSWEKVGTEDKRVEENLGFLLPDR